MVCTTKLNLLLCKIYVHILIIKRLRLLFGEKQFLGHRSELRGEATSGVRIWQTSLFAHE